MTDTSHTTTQSAGRIASLDLARGLAVLFMIWVHVLDFYGNAEAHNSWTGQLIEFFGRAPSAPVFMLIMGIFIALSKRLTLASGLKRAAILLGIGYALNLARGSVPMWLSLQWGLVTQTQLGPHTPLTELLIVDILQFAGIAYALCAILKHLRPAPSVCIALAFGIVSVSPLLWDLSIKSTIGDEWLQLFWGSETQGVMFPQFPWLVYPLIGMAFGYWMQTQKDMARLYRRSMLCGLGLIVVGSCVIRTNYDFHAGDYYRSGPGLMIWNTGFVFCWLWLCHVVVTRIPGNALFNRIYKWSRQVTTIYVLQWLLIGWGLMAVGFQQLSLLQTVLAITCILLVSDLGAGWWSRLRDKPATEPSQA